MIRKTTILLLFFLPVLASARTWPGMMEYKPLQPVHYGMRPLAPASDDFNPRNGWFIKGGYIRQNKLNWAELSLARWHESQYTDEDGTSISAVGEAITLGSEFGFGDTTGSVVLAPKIGAELHVILIGVRTSFAHYMKAGKSTNCFSLEGGLCLVSVLYVYYGYNWMLGSESSLVEKSGGKIAIGLNIPFGMHDAGLHGVGKRSGHTPVYSFR